MARSYGTPNKEDVANFLSSITGLPEDDKDNGIYISTLKSNKVDIILSLYNNKLSVLEKIYNSLLKNKTKLKDYFGNYSLPPLIVKLTKDGGAHTLSISNVRSYYDQKSFDI